MTQTYWKTIFLLLLLPRLASADAGNTWPQAAHLSHYAEVPHIFSSTSEFIFLGDEDWFSFYTVNRGRYYIGIAGGPSIVNVTLYLPQVAPAVGGQATAGGYCVVPATYTGTWLDDPRILTPQLNQDDTITVGGFSPVLYFERTGNTVVSSTTLEKTFLQITSPLASFSSYRVIVREPWPFETISGDTVASPLNFHVSQTLTVAGSILAQGTGSFADTVQGVTGVEWNDFVILNQVKLMIANATFEAATELSAARIKDGTFGADVGGNNYTFPNDLRIVGYLDAPGQPYTLNVVTNTIPGATYFEYILPDWDVPGGEWYGMVFRSGQPEIWYQDSSMADFDNPLVGAYPAAHSGIRVFLAEGLTWSAAYEVHIIGLLDSIDSDYISRLGLRTPTWIELTGWLADASAHDYYKPGLWTPCDTKALRLPGGKVAWMGGGR